MEIQCEKCGEILKYQDFQSHLIEVHKILFVQYIGLISSKIKFKILKIK